MFGKLFVVSTPIGNLQDITLRAIETLKTVDIIACEDTRHTGKLLKALSIKNKLISVHEHNEAERAAELCSDLLEGRSVAIVSDAGTPAINDPGFRLVAKAVETGIEVVSVPGPTAFVAAVTISGLPTDAIFFGGFLPSKKSERRKRLMEVKDIPATVVFYESPHRIAAALADCEAMLGDRKAAVARELTKLHEEVIRGSLSELISTIKESKIRGEFVLMISRDDARNLEISGRSISEIVYRLESEGMIRKNALKQAAKLLGITRSEAYRQLNMP